MKNKYRIITIKLRFDMDEWQGYDDVVNELMIEDSGIYDGLKTGVRVEQIINGDKTK